MRHDEFIKDEESRLKQRNREKAYHGDNKRETKRRDEFIFEKNSDVTHRASDASNAGNRICCRMYLLRFRESDVIGHSSLLKRDHIRPYIIYLCVCILLCIEHREKELTHFKILKI